MNLFEIFRVGSVTLCNATMSYASVHENYGINKDSWDLVTSKEIWTVAQRNRVRSILSELCNISMTISGIPAQPLPAQYVAALISNIVSPCNRLVACSCAPESYDGELSSGLLGKVELRNVPLHTMISLVVAYSSKQYIEPSTQAVKPEIADQSVKQVADTSDKKRASK